MNGSARQLPMITNDNRGEDPGPNPPRKKRKVTSDQQREMMPPPIPPLASVRPVPRFPVFMHRPPTLPRPWMQPPVCAFRPPCSGPFYQLRPQMQPPMQFPRPNLMPDFNMQRFDGLQMQHGSPIRALVPNRSSILASILTPNMHPQRNLEQVHYYGNPILGHDGQRSTLVRFGQEICQPLDLTVPKGRRGSPTMVESEKLSAARLHQPLRDTIFMQHQIRPKLPTIIEQEDAQTEQKYQIRPSTPLIILPTPQKDAHIEQAHCDVADPENNADGDEGNGILIKTKCPDTDEWITLKEYNAKMYNVQY